MNIHQAWSFQKINMILNMHLYNKPNLSWILTSAEIFITFALYGSYPPPRLPGEAMQIDRVMDAFSSHYCEQNPNIFEEPDTCFILSFSIIMLNTALHNPNAKMKVII